ncbi:YlxR family protein [Agromyces mediolanus]|uniref:YlxR family protein n=1 Tax=Agromyces mediolanus TaxID=41986 RepID=UPI0038397A99
MEPVRTCIGCRARAPRSSLLRVVLQDSRLVADAAAVRPGRGAWLHPTNECFLLADRRRAFGRALRFTGALDTSDIQNRLNG